MTATQDNQEQLSSVLPEPSTRVAYEKPPLVEVICQLRFPTILRIQSEIPSQFQERVRAKFPNYNEKTKDQFGDAPPEVKSLLKQFSQNTTEKSYEFISEDEQWTVNLGSGHISLSTTGYKRWAGFTEFWQPVFEAFVEVYKPAYFSRVGLRYIDFINKNTLGLQGAGWGEILAPHIAGVLGATEVSKAVYAQQSQTHIEIDSGGTKCAVRHGLGEGTAANGTVQGYILDCDIFKETKVEYGKTAELLNQFNEYSGRVFRWCIGETLHEAMGPN